MSVDTIAYKELGFDLTIYPRETTDADRVAVLKEVLEAGGELPPIVIDARTRRVVDGFHRARAHFSLYGVEARVPCERRTYADGKEMLLDAVRLNASHGKPLTTIDHERCASLAYRAGITTEQLASVLSVRTSRVKSLRDARAATSRGPRTTVARPTRRQPVEDGVELGYQPPVGLRQINELNAALQAGRLNVRERNMRDSLKALARVILERLKATEEKAA